MFHMGWFLSWQVQSWNAMWSGEGATEWNQPDLYIDMAHALERAGFDYLMFEDGSFVPDSYGGSHDWWLANARSVPKQDPMALIAVLSRCTEHIGLIGTMTTSFYPPYMAARMMSTLDHLSHGRVGANLVTSHNTRTAQNFGHQELFEHDRRYEMADEWITLVKQLWASWEPDAVVLDRERGVFADGSKVHPVNFEGEFFSCRGPLNTTAPPQGRPAICQAGGSPAGRAFAARHADTIIAQCRGAAGMKEFRDDVRARMVEAGRDPDECKILFIVSPVLGETRQDADEKQERLLASFRTNLDINLSSLSYATGVDFAQFDLDAPFPQFETNATRSSLSMMSQAAGDRTLREAVSGDIREAVALVGTPDAVAAQMGELYQEVGGDGFLISGNVNRRYISEIADGLAPELRKRKLIRDGYQFGTLRENLLEF